MTSSKLGRLNINFGKLDWENLVEPYIKSSVTVGNENQHRTASF